MTPRSTALGLIAIAGALALPAIGQASSVPPTSEPTGTAPATTEPAATAPSGTATDSSAAPGGAVDLTDVCPDPLIIQTDWFPESEYGAVYGLLGDDYTIDTDNKTVSGSLTAGGQDTGIDIEIRAGGSAITGGVSGVMYTDDNVTFGFGTTDGQILRWSETPLMSVVAPLDINPQIIMWDPATYPDVETIADLGEAGVTVNVFQGQTFTDVLVGQGILNADQIDPSYDGSPARFIAEDGAIAQQGFASSEPYLYENEIEEWGKPVAYQTIHDAGFQVYSQTLAIRPDDLDALRPCLEQFVPVVQQSAVDFVNDPARTNAAIVDIVAQYDTFWTYTPELADYSVATQLELGLTGNGPDEVPDDLVATDLFTNEFIDESIGLDS